MMLKSGVTVIDYGMGNIRSVVNAVEHLGYSAAVSSDPDAIFGSSVLILPGVGSFRKAMERLQVSGLDQAILEAVREKGIKILGICLGMQLMAAVGTEDGDTAGLGLIDATVNRFSTEEVEGNKIPHVGFNLVQSLPDSILFHGLPEKSDFYFVHSYRILPSADFGLNAICNYGVSFLAAFEHDCIFGTQFHPEKSQTNGLILLKNFLSQ